MTYQATQEYPHRAELPRWIIVGFVAGALSVLVFHQGAAALLHALDLTPRAPYSLQPTRPLGVPQLTSIAFWGGLWGILLAATVFGAIVPRWSRGSWWRRSRASPWRPASCRRR